MQRNSPSIRRILFLTVGALTLLIAFLASRELFSEWRQLAKIQSLKEASLLSDKLFTATEQLAMERDVASTWLRANDQETIENLHKRMQESRRLTDENMQAVLRSSQRYHFDELDTLWQDMETHFAAITELRVRIDKAMEQPLSFRDLALGRQWEKETNAVLDQTRVLWLGFVGHFTSINPLVTQHLRYKHFMRLITDYTGKERAIVGKLIVENASPTPEDFTELLRAQGTLEVAWDISHLLAEQSGLYPGIASYYKDAKSHFLTLHDMTRSFFAVPNGQRKVTYPISAELWLELSAQATESLDTLKAVSFTEAQRYLEELETNIRQAIFSYSLFLLFALGLCIYSFWVISRRVVRPINVMIEALLNATAGKTISLQPMIANRQDEIGKLAQVLFAFQQNVDNLKDYMQALERSNKELDDFAYIASHDLKEPLRGIHNHSRFLLEDNEGKLDKESVSKLNRLVYLSQRMEMLVNDLLYFSRLGRQELAVQPTNINKVIHDIETTLEQFLAERTAKIVIPSPLPTVTVDKPRITELFRNLITNAVKYNDSPEKRIEIGYLAAYKHAKTDELLKNVFYVRDNGRGIAAEFHDEIFRIFRRLQSSKEDDEGTGVGLTFVKKIVERHGGKIWLESEPGGGAVFYFTLLGESHDPSRPA
jgi:signal transduction histidine kinase